MKTLLVAAVLLVVPAACLLAQSEEVIALEGWRFITGDDPAYAAPDYDDASWREIETDRIWEQQGYDPYDGYAWYRVRVVIPSRIREDAFLKDTLRVYLGKINNFDQAFINGRLLGVNGVNQAADATADNSFIDAPTELWDIPRRYTLGAGDPRIRWDAENVIAVRVYDEGGQGGLWSGDQAVGMVNIVEFLSVDYEARPFVFEGGRIGKRVCLINSSEALTLRGTFSITARDKLSGEALFTLEEAAALAPLEEKEYSLDIPARDQSATVQYRFAFSETREEAVFSEETPYILTPPPPKSPRINGAAVFGARPGRPFLYTIAATGERPMSFAAEGLPDGLAVDEQTGIISGSVREAGAYEATLFARNSLGEASRGLRIEVGDRVALTPPMGWNSWNCWGLSVSQELVLRSARAFVDKGLVEHGWTYVNIDDGWEIVGDSPEPKREADGTIRVNEKFPDMKALGDAIHAMGLKFGIYTSPGPLTCGGYTASYEHELQDARTFAAWGVDYIKYDWCSYDGIAKDRSLPELMKPYELMRDSLAQVDRDIVYSLCQYGMGDVWEWGAEVGGNLWRTTGDITDTWESLRGIGFSQVENAPCAGPGHWNDPDMLVVGWVGWGPHLHPTRLTPDEQYTHISLWCLLSAPLLIGCDLERLDPFTLNLLTNDEVLALDQDPLGSQAAPLLKDGDVQVWVKELADGSRAVGLFNLGEATVTYTLDLSAVGGGGAVRLRDLWRQKDLGTFQGTFEVTIPAHGVVLVKPAPASE